MGSIFSASLPLTLYKNAPVDATVDATGADVQASVHAPVAATIHGNNVLVVNQFNFAFSTLLSCVMCGLGVIGITFLFSKLHYTLSRDYFLYMFCRSVVVVVIAVLATFVILFAMSSLQTWTRNHQATQEARFKPVQLSADQCPEWNGHKEKCS